MLEGGGDGGGAVRMAQLNELIPTSPMVMSTNPS